MRPAWVSRFGVKGFEPPPPSLGGAIWSAVGRIRSGRSAISQSSLAGFACLRAHVPYVQLLGNDGLDRLFPDREHAASLDVETELFGLGIADLAEAARDGGRLKAERLAESVRECLDVARERA